MSVKQRTGCALAWSALLLLAAPACFDSLDGLSQSTTTPGKLGMPGGAGAPAASGEAGQPVQGGDAGSSASAGGVASSGSSGTAAAGRGGAGGSSALQGGSSSQAGTAGSSTDEGGAGVSSGGGMSNTGGVNTAAGTSSSGGASAGAAESSSGGASGAAATEGGASAGTGAAGSPQPPNPLTTGSRVSLKGRLSSQCIDVRGTKTPDGLQPTVLAECVSSSPFQQFLITEVSALTFQLQSVSDATCLDVAKNLLVEGTPIVTYRCMADRKNQHFAVEAAADGHFVLRSDRSGLCLEPLGEVELGAPIIQAACTGSSAQMWAVTAPGGLL